jgi:GT2 family glycosyltransferase
MTPSDDNEALFIVDGDVASAATWTDVSPEGFDETTYRRAFPDIARAIRAGEWRSALHHYREFGEREGRLNDVRYRDAAMALETADFPPTGIDTVFLSPTGRCLVIGWMNDTAEPLSEVMISSTAGRLAVLSGAARCRREDAEAVVAIHSGKLLGFWCLAQIDPAGAGEPGLDITLAAGRQRRSFPVTIRRTDDDRLRDMALEYLAGAKYFSSPQVEAFIQLDQGLGTAIIALNAAISRKILAGAYTTRFGPQPASLDGSIIVCLFGKPEYLFLQAALFSAARGAERYEFIYVSNSPELAEMLVKEATMASRIYGLSITLIILPGNAGFGAANNCAVNAARSSRILIVNPDVFPRDTDWAQRHTALVRTLPADQVALFGAPLYYDDGSLMHGGMFIDVDVGLSVRHDAIERREMLRVEHYGKGAPPDTAAYLASRPVPAVTGAFISADRTWFEQLGGFSLDYVMGHYEDADLCLKSLVGGKPAWLHNLPFWHMEGKGSDRRFVHEGGSLVNRWYFTASWSGLVADGMGGPQPPRLIRS